MSFTLELSQNGIYIKDKGRPLLPCQLVLLADGLYNLPRHCEETRGNVLIIRDWRIAVDNGHRLLREFMPVNPERGWPW